MVNSLSRTSAVCLTLHRTKFVATMQYHLLAILTLALGCVGRASPHARFTSSLSPPFRSHTSKSGTVPMTTFTSAQGSCQRVVTISVPVPVPVSVTISVPVTTTKTVPVTSPNSLSRTITVYDPATSTVTSGPPVMGFKSDGSVYHPRDNLAERALIADSDSQPFNAVSSEVTILFSLPAAPSKTEVFPAIPAHTTAFVSPITATSAGLHSRSSEDMSSKAVPIPVLPVYAPDNKRISSGGLIYLASSAPSDIALTADNRPVDEGDRTLSRFAPNVAGFLTSGAIHTTAPERQAKLPVTDSRSVHVEPSVVIPTPHFVSLGAPFDACDPKTEAMVTTTSGKDPATHAEPSKNQVADLPLSSAPGVRPEASHAATNGKFFNGQEPAPTQRHGPTVGFPVNPDSPPSEEHTRVDADPAHTRYFAKVSPDTEDTLPIAAGTVPETGPKSNEHPEGHPSVAQHKSGVPTGFDGDSIPGLSPHTQGGVPYFGQGLPSAKPTGSDVEPAPTHPGHRVHPFGALPTDVGDGNEARRTPPIFALRGVTQSSVPGPSVSTATASTSSAPGSNGSEETEDSSPDTKTHSIGTKQPGLVTGTGSARVKESSITTPGAGSSNRTKSTTVREESKSTGKRSSLSTDMSSTTPLSSSLPLVNIATAPSSSPSSTDAPDSAGNQTSSIKALRSRLRSVFGLASFVLFLGL